MDKETLLRWQPAVVCLTLVCALLWGSAFPLLKIGFGLLQIVDNTAGKLYFAGYRFLLAGAMIFAGVLAVGRPVALPRKKDYAVMLLIGLMQTTLQYTFFYIGLSFTTGIKASIITGSGSFYLALLSHWLIRDDSLSVKNMAGLVVGFVGLLVLNLKKGEISFEMSLLGEGFIFLGVFLSALATIAVKKTAVRLYPPLMVGYQLTLGAIVLLMIAAAMEPPSVLHFSPPTLMIMIYLSFVSAAAFSLWYVLVKYNDLTRMAVYRFLIPVCGTFLSAVIMETETLDWSALMALSLVCCGMVMTAGGGKRRWKG